ncbi:transcription factor 21 [Athene cunicularia]|uniref:transcription factor 21 n=1 Tax=Athene cunicularia TaxID=194338 RepID=UPI000EF6F3C7|nr:transcription factor 21 [Athene cunicularia]
MSTGSLSDVEDLQEVEMLECDGLKMDTNKEFGASTESNEEGSNGENGSPQKGRGASGKRKKAPPKKSPLNGVSQEGKQVQRNAANARERARMRVLSKAFSRLKTTLPWVPPDTKLSKLDTLRLASSYIAHLRQILANDKYENGYIHPVNLKLASLDHLHLAAVDAFLYEGAGWQRCRTLLRDRPNREANPVLTSDSVTNGLAADFK